MKDSLQATGREDARQAAADANFVVSTVKRLLDFCGNDLAGRGVE